MIVIRIHEGLGNQMFQYAAGRALSRRVGATLKLDLRWFSENRTRRFELDAFRLEAVPATEEEVEWLTRHRVPGRRHLPLRILAALGLYHPPTVFRQHTVGFLPEILGAGPNTYLDGYWQSEDYFSDAADLIRHDFTLSDRLSESARRWLDRIDESEEPVSIHVRRGDYASDPVVRQNHGTLTLSYYERALRRVREDIEEPSLFVFSDDPEWVWDEFLPRIPRAFLVNGLTALEDLHLMTRCKHHVIANSSFSWWGAWLASRRDGVKIAPTRWFDAKAGNTSRIVPDRWVRV